MTETTRGPLLAGGEPGQIIVKRAANTNQTVWTDPSNAGMRSALTANRDYYVSPSGKDTNDGLSVATAFASPQHAADVIAGLDLGGRFAVTVNVADGAYPTGIICSADPIGAWPGSVTFIGNITTPLNVKLQPAQGYFIDGITVNGCKAYRFGGFALYPTYYGNGFLASNGAVSQIWDMYMNMDDTMAGYSIIADNARLDVFRPGSFTEFGNMTHDGSGFAFLTTINGGVMRYFAKINTFLNSPAWEAAFAFSWGASRLEISKTLTFTGATTGKKYDVQQNAIIDTGGAGAAYLPGTIAGTVISGGQYV